MYFIDSYEVDLIRCLLPADLVLRLGRNVRMSFLFLLHSFSRTRRTSNGSKLRGNISASKCTSYMQGVLRLPECISEDDEGRSWETRFSSCRGFRRGLARLSRVSTCLSELAHQAFECDTPYTFCRRRPYKFSLLTAALAMPTDQWHTSSHRSRLGASSLDWLVHADGDARGYDRS